VQVEAREQHHFRYIGERVGFVDIASEGNKARAVVEIYLNAGVKPTPGLILLIPLRRKSNHLLYLCSIALDLSAMVEELDDVVEELDDVMWLRVEDKEMDTAKLLRVMVSESTTGKGRKRKTSFVCMHRYIAQGQRWPHGRVCKH